MNIDLTRLRSGVDKNIPIDISYSFDRETLGNDIKSLDNVKIVGEIYRNSIDDYILVLKIKGTAILTCAITLKDVPYEFEIDLDDSIVNLFEDIGIKLKNIGNTIDILPIIWQNIVMEIPTYVVSPGASSTELEGDGWSLNKSKKEENSALSKLKDLF